MHTRATPGVYAIERSSRVFTAIRPLTSIFPPRCIRNVRSDTLTTVMPSTPLSPSTMRWPWASSEHLKVTSRVMVWPPASTMSTAPMSPPASPIAEVTLPSMPGRLAIRMRAVRL